MELFDCAVGQRVVHRENGKSATVKALWRAENQVEIQFDGGSVQRVNPKLLAIGGGTDVPGHTIKHPCPQCSTDMGAEPKCSKCGFAYREAQPTGMPAAAKLLITLVVLAGIGFVVWKFVLGGKLP